MAYATFETGVEHALSSNDECVSKTCALNALQQKVLFNPLPSSQMNLGLWHEEEKVEQKTFPEPGVEDKVEEKVKLGRGVEEKVEQKTFPFNVP